MVKNDQKQPKTAKTILKVAKNDKNGPKMYYLALLGRLRSLCQVALKVLK